MDVSKAAINEPLARRVGGIVAAVEPSVARLDNVIALCFSVSSDHLSQLRLATAGKSLGKSSRQNRERSGARSPLAHRCQKLVDELHFDAL